MLDLEDILSVRPVLILNKPHICMKGDFYSNLFNIPEVLNRLRQYRDLLSQNDLNIPVWVYCLTQDIDTLKGSPQPDVLQFLVSLGLYDRYISKSGWPSYIVGSEPLISVISGDSTFESEVLDITKGVKSYSKFVKLFQAQSYYNKRTDSFCLTSLKLKQKSYSLENILNFLEKDTEIDGREYRFLSPHEEELLFFMTNFKIQPKEFLEYDDGLKWLWPLWKKSQIQSRQKISFSHNPLLQHE